MLIETSTCVEDFKNKRRDDTDWLGKTLHQTIKENSCSYRAGPGHQNFYRASYKLQKCRAL